MISRNSLFVAGAIAFSLIASACGGGSPTSPNGSVEFTGVWQGSWQRTSCSETGGAVGNACSQTPTSGALRLTLTQTGSSVAGNVEVASFVIPASGSVSANGTLNLTGSAHLQNATETLSNWSTTRGGNSMNGSFTLTIVADNQAFGSQTLVLTLQSVTKSS
jgi:hypothetical protein